MASWKIKSLIAFLIIFCSVGAENENGERKSCTDDRECEEVTNWQYPYMTCDKTTSVCRCPANLPCIHMTFSSMVWWEYNNFCGICNEMGSTCFSNSDCPTVSRCMAGYCLCNEPASNKNDMCRIDKVIPTISITTVWMVVVLIATITINKTIGSKRFRNRLRFWRYRIRRRPSPNSPVVEDGVHQNPNRNNKSAAFTISNSDFISTTEDHDLDWAIEFSLMEVDRQSRSREEIPDEPASNLDQNTSPTTNIEIPLDDTVTLGESQNIVENNLQNNSQKFEPILEQINVPELLSSAVAESSNTGISQQENTPMSVEVGASSSKNTSIEDKDSFAYENTCFEDDKLPNLNERQFSRAYTNSQSSNRSRRIRLVPRQSYRRNASPPLYLSQQL